MKTTRYRKTLVGLQFGQRTVLALAGSYEVRKRCTGKLHKTSSLWKCRCSCGELRNVERGALLRGFTKSCGCWRVKHGREQAAAINAKRWGTPPKEVAHDV